MTAGMNVAIRADASPAIGSGHVMRCLSLADGLRRHGASVSFVSRSLPGHLAALVTGRGHDVISVGAAEPAPYDPADAALDDLPHCDWLVVDHYGLDARWETSMRARASKVLVIDDLADRTHDCDVLLDQNVHADAAGRYAGRVPPHAELLLGPQFALLRPEFRAARERTSPRAGDVRRVLVSFGGTDPTNETGDAIEALAAALPDLAHVDVVIGAGHARRADVEAACLRHGYACHVQSDAMGELMAAADLALGAGGVSTWERCCVGLPALAVAVASNQVGVLEQAAASGLVYAIDAPVSADRLGLHLRALADNATMRHGMSRAGLDAVDGLGVDRALAAMGLDEIHVREAVAGDAKPLFEWRNHESVRLMSRRPEPVGWAEHEAWLSAVSADPDRVLLIGERGGQAVGVVRFDVRGEDAEVSIYRAPSSTERGLGARLLRSAERWLASRHPGVTRLTAEVLEENQRSHRLFRSAGYQPRSSTYEKQVHP
jgi:UDP-2,4-diacetamido-2,4,6-trideoxy-beta-L-altropyranose hydrolase